MSSAEGGIRQGKITAICNSHKPSLESLRELAWTGLPQSVSWAERSLIWKLLLSIIPPDVEEREQVLLRKRSAYRATAAAYFGSVLAFNHAELSDLSNSPVPGSDIDDSSGSPGGPEKSPVDLTQLRQIRADLARTRPDEFSPIFVDRRVQSVLTRSLYTWAIKNPAAGYVQGINDILVPFFIVFLLGECEHFAEEDIIKNPSLIPTEIIYDAEADSHMALQLLLSEIQDNFIADQPGISRQLEELKSILTRVNPESIQHLDRIGVSVKQITFRWENCLLARELSVRCHIQLCDTFVAEGFKNLKVLLRYVSLALLLRFAPEMMNLDFQDAMMFVQSPPSQSWDSAQIETLVAEAFVWKSLFENCPNQISSGGS